MISISDPYDCYLQGILINGQFPGPDIYSVTNDNLIVNVFNSLDEPFLLSWLEIFFFPFALCVDHLQCFRNLSKVANGALTNADLQFCVKVIWFLFVWRSPQSSLFIALVHEISSNLVKNKVKNK